MAINIEHFCAPVIHPVTYETISKYQKLSKDPYAKDIQRKEFGEEFGNLAQGNNKIKLEVMDSIFSMERHEIKNILKDLTITYSFVSVDLLPQKEDPN